MPIGGVKGGGRLRRGWRGSGALRRGGGRRCGREIQKGGKTEAGQKKAGPEREEGGGGPKVAAMGMSRKEA